MPTVPDPNAVRATGKNAFTTIEGEGIDEQPDLPELYIPTEVIVKHEDGAVEEETRSVKVQWHDEVRKAWDVIWQSPLRKEYNALDLAGMHAAMLCLQMYYQKPQAATLTEWRMWCNEFGWTPSARRKMRIVIGPVGVPNDKGKKGGEKKPARKDPRRT